MLTDDEIVRDAARSAALAAQGFAILRFTNDEVFRNLDGVLETIRARLIEAAHRGVRDLKLGATTHPDPPP
jgi:very-short-patch-repair endonuclease